MLCTEDLMRFLMERKDDDKIMHMLDTMHKNACNEIDHLGHLCTISSIEERKRIFHLLLDTINTHEHMICVISVLNTTTRNISEMLATTGNTMLHEFRTKLVADRRIQIGLADLLQQREDEKGSNNDQRRLLENFLEYLTFSHATSHPELNKLCRVFSRNIKLSNFYTCLYVTDPKDTMGIPEHILSSSGTQTSQGNPVWYFSSIHHYHTIMETATSRHLRERMYKLFVSRCSKGSDYDNSHHLESILALRRDIARNLGFESYVDMMDHQDSITSLFEKQKPKSTILDMIDQCWAAAAKEREDVERYAHERGAPTPLMPWDFPFWINQVYENVQGYSDKLVDQYMDLPTMFSALTQLIKKLFDVDVTPCTEEETYTWHPDVRVFCVSEDRDNNTHIVYGYIYVDPYMRPEKSDNTCEMFPFGQRKKDIPSRVLVSCSMDKNHLTFDDAMDLFHEFGHALEVMMTCPDIPDEACTQDISGYEFVSILMEKMVYYDRHIFFTLVQKQVDLDERERIYTHVCDIFRFRYLTKLLRFMKIVLLDRTIHSVDATIPIDKLDFLCTDKFVWRNLYCGRLSTYLWGDVLSADVLSDLTTTDDPLQQQRIGRRFKDIVLKNNRIESSQKVFRHFRERDPDVAFIMSLRSGNKRAPT